MHRGECVCTSAVAHAAQDDWRMPGEAGVAFLDVGFGHPGTHLAAFSSQTFQAWVPAFYARLAAHMQRAGASIGRAGLS